MAQKHLVVQTAFWGDLLLTIPLIRRIRELYPDHEIDLICRHGLGQFFLKMGLVERAYEVDKASGQTADHLVSSLKGYVYDNVYCPHRSFRSARVVRRLKAKQRVGFKRWWNFWAFNKRVEYPSHLPEAIRLLSLLRDEDSEAQNEVERVDRELREHPEWRSEVGSVTDRLLVSPISSLKLDLERIRSGVKSADLQKWIEILKSKNTWVLAPGSVWPTKRWTATDYGGLARELVSRGHQIVLVGSPSEISICDSVARLEPSALNLGGKTQLSDLMVLLYYARGIVCNDSGPMHMASVVGLPTVAIFGPTTLELGYRPWQDRALVVQKKLECRPCGKHGARKCPLNTHECMKSISARDVLKSVRALEAQL